MKRHTRYQGAIVQDGKLLIISHRRHDNGHEYWLLPGGGIESGETEHECVVREMLEETGLQVRVERLLLQKPDIAPAAIYQQINTYLCTPIGGVASPGYEPEIEASAVYSIHAVRWISLADEIDWGQAVKQNVVTYPQLQAIRATLGYA